MTTQSIDYQARAAGLLASLGIAPSQTLATLLALPVELVEAEARVFTFDAEPEPEPFVWSGMYDGADSPPLADDGQPAIEWAGMYSENGGNNLNGSNE